MEENSDIDIVLLDIMMPIMDGYKTITAIRENNKLKDLPIIMVSAKDVKDEKDKVISLGANDFISKPITKEAFYALIYKHLNSMS